MTKKYRIGVDVGGTNVKVALVSNTGDIIYSNSVPTGSEMGFDYTIGNIKIKKKTDFSNSIKYYFG